MSLSPFLARVLSSLLQSQAPSTLPFQPIAGPRPCAEAEEEPRSDGERAGFPMESGAVVRQGRDARGHFSAKCLNQ